ncbi:diphosphomevalonate decarboxylase [Anaerolineales bacterium]
MGKVTAQASPNIAFIKYWGNENDDLRIPVNSSISMNLKGIYTETSVELDDQLQATELLLNNQPADETARARVDHHLNMLQNQLGLEPQSARVVSTNNFPMGAGIASSASAFAALTLATVKALGVDLSEAEISSLARLGSGSASRSIPSGFVVWHKGHSHETSFAESIASPEHWDLVDVIAVVSKGHKRVGSSAGHLTAQSSDLQQARVQGAEARLAGVIEAIQQRDFATFADIVEYDSNLMHAVMMTSRPALFYWQPASIQIMDLVRELRLDGVDVCYTLDAGPNVHCICTAESAPLVNSHLQAIEGVEDILLAPVGDKAVILDS